ncbi:transposase [Paraburkholderia sediminicola]|nr:transposase [Paraburkholderia sediminicola]
MTPFREMTDEEWQRIAPLFPEFQARKELRGRPLRDTRAVFNGLLWVMYTDSAWSAMPCRYPPHTTCHRRFMRWHESGVLTRVADALSGSMGNDLYGLIHSRTRGSKLRPATRRQCHDGDPGLPARSGNAFNRDDLPHLCAHGDIARPPQM